LKKKISLFLTGISILTCVGSSIPVFAAPVVRDYNVPETTKAYVVQAPMTTLAQIGEGTIKVDAANVRSGPGTGYTSLGLLFYGNTFPIYSIVKGTDGMNWAYNGRGYIRSDMYNSTAY
jgi:hypothetical protein